MIPQTPFTQSTIDDPRSGAAQGRRHATSSLIYDDKKTTYRTEVDQALRTAPDVILCQRLHARHGRAAEGPLPRGLQGQDHGLRLLDQPEAGRPGRPERGGRGRLHLRAVAGRGQRRATSASRTRVGSANPDPYTSQVYDHINLVLMAIALGKAATGDGDQGQHPQGHARRRQAGRQRRRRPQGDRRRREGRLLRRVGPLRLRRQGRHPRLQVPLRADQGRQVHPGEDRLSVWMSSSRR